MRFNRKYTRALASFFLIEFCFFTFFPTIAHALTSGPNAPEFASFTPVATTDMVNLFTGDFNYNLPVIEIPGAEGGGYAMSLSYNSGNGSEQEASWVGFGWSLNPGSINRNVRGFPDDYNGNTVDFYNKTRPNWTTSAGLTAGIEAFSKDVPLGINASSTLRFNNYQGYTKAVGFGLSAAGMASLSINMDNDGITFSGDINPIKILKKLKTKSVTDADNNPQSNTDKSTLTSEEEEKLKKEQIKAAGEKAISAKSPGSVNMFGSSYGIASFSEALRATNFVKYRGFGFNWSVSGQLNSPVPVGFQVGAQGSFSMQFNESKSSLPAFGYMHSNNANDESMMDYYTEKGAAYDKRDYFIGMPFNNHDIFSLTGEGLSGGFRAFNDQVGHYKPNSGASSIKISQIGYEFMFGFNVGVGLDFGIGSQKTTINPWDALNSGSFAGSSIPQIFRFSNDLGGTAFYTSNTSMETAKVLLMNPIYGFRTTEVIAPIADPSRSGAFKLDSEKGRSSFISQNHETDDPNKLITAFTVYNEEGLKYAYTEPVFVRNETNLSVDISKSHNKEWRYFAFRDLKLSKNGSDGYQIAEGDLNSESFTTAVGEIRRDKYVNNYLLKSICTPDYVDKTGDGPSQDDFGGWTRFDYRKKYGDGKNEWYRYRTPYNGLLYQQNSISDTKDDVGSIVTGEKEVQYLETIETNTHIAYFVTNKSTSDISILNGTGRERLDGLGASPINSNDPAAIKSTNGKPIQGTTKLEFLEKIVLFPKNISGNPVHDKPVKVVHFDYNWSLTPNVPNNINSTYIYSDNSNNIEPNTGKLTLKKVWFEYGGVVSANISPYEFGYQYKHSSQVSADFSPYFSEYDALPENKQNPVYSPHILSPWGYPMANGKERKENDIPWIDQSYYVEEEQIFDPAAWQLKSIKLPSGGEIIVQYEEKDYSYVQDREAMAMASVTKNAIEVGYNDDPEYFINPEDLGASSENLTEVQELKDRIDAHFLDEKGYPKQKIYFKFLYALKGANPSLDDCRSEYISGYANFKQANVEQVNDKYLIKIILNGGSGDRTPVPRQACYELVSNQKQGKLDNSDCIDPIYEAVYDKAVARAADGSQSGSLSGAIKRGVAAASMTQMAVDPRVITYTVDHKQTVCNIISPEHSFLKLPMLAAKKGGGVRVKRLLMYDPGIEQGDEAVYGTEYLYVMEDGKTSSGVATTEPSGAREENPLVTFLPKKEQKWFSRITVGEDKEQTEGPLGESVLPGASIGYSRVVTKNIHTGKTGTGFSVHEYYTVKDFPFDGSYGDKDSPDFDVSGLGADKTVLEDQQVTDWLNIPAGLFNYKTNKVWTAQGFRFILNNMHGQVRKQANYGGSYLSSSTDGYLVSFQEYEYYEVGEKVKMLRWDEANNTFEEYFDTPGKEMDITMEAKKLKDTNIDFTIELDISATISFVPPIFVGVWPSFSYSDKTIATHATTKILRYPAILKKVTSSQDGVVSVTENVAFSKATGQSILTRTFDSYNNLLTGGSTVPHNGSVYTFSVPAEWVYPQMGQKATNLSYTNQLKSQTAIFKVYGIEPNPDWFMNPNNVLSAGVQSFSNNWTSSWTDPKIDGDYNSSAHQAALNNVWRPSSSWVYKSDDPVSSASDKIYESGYFNLNSMFDWDNEFNQADNNWIMSSQITKYSPHGQVLEEKNALNIPSAALFGTQYGNHLPVMVAQNAAYDNIFFNDYENINSTNSKNHSGTGSKKISHGENLAQGLKVTSHLVDKGGLFFVWLNFSSASEENSLQAYMNGHTQPLEKVARTGEWTLYKAEINGSSFNSIGLGNAFTIGITSGNGQFSQSIFADDVRFQPLDAEAGCYVYDYSTFRLIAQYDSEHFGTYYQYNEEGQLVRKLIETERGLKTITETQYNTVKQNRTL